MEKGYHSWKMRVGADPNQTLGVAAKPRISHEDQFEDKAYHWHSGSGEAIIPEDSEAECTNELSQWSSRDTFQFQLDCDNHTLQITNLRNGATSTITNLPSQEYFPFAALAYEGSSVEFVD